jgi:hypothetical protein
MITREIDRKGSEYLRAAVKFMDTQDKILDEVIRFQVTGGLQKNPKRLAQLMEDARRLKQNYRIDFADLGKISAWRDSISRSGIR